jgi:ubiquinol-cytochrome c reductase iron-sulfur subunit
MSAVAHAPQDGPHHGPQDGHAPDQSKRDFLKLVAASSAAIGVGALAWPLVDSMNPSSDVLALSSVEFDLAPVPVGQAVTVVWRGKPIFVRHRSAEEIKTAEGVKLADLSDPASDDSRVKAGEAQWLVVVGICTHLGCVPLGNKPTDNRGDFGGWFCPCHGSQYDVSGRVRHGPAPANLPVPPYAFMSPSRIKIG